MAEESKSKANAAPAAPEVPEIAQGTTPPAGSYAKQKNPAKGPTGPKESDPKTQDQFQPAGAGGTMTRWTIMVYIAADALLANFGIESLKQLSEGASSPAVDGDTSVVVVAAQFSIDAPGGQPLPRYVFDGSSGGNLGRSLKDTFQAPPNMTEQEALTSFLDWVYKRSDCTADYYALVLWSHGPQLFLQPPPGDPTGSSGSLYLTPIQLRHALKDGIPPEKAATLKIIGFDACSMSMVEMAYEIRELAPYMVASQEEVPDLSFPYSTMVQLVRRYGTNAECLLQQAVRSYVRNYQDYITNAITSMQPVTLSAFRLNDCGALSASIKGLATSLLDSLGDPDLPAYLISAREKSRDYAGGLYVDLLEFCTNLYEQLYPSTAEEEDDEALGLCGQPATAKGAEEREAIIADVVARKKAIREACHSVLQLLHVDTHGTSTGFVLINCSRDTRSHGVSLYLPYLSDEQASEIVQPLVKGTRDVPAKGITTALNASASGYLISQRQTLILDTEGYYGDLGFATYTQWYDFVTKFWTRILISLSPGTLDLRYSSVQSAINAVRK